MGLMGLFHWLGEDIDKLKTLKSMTKNEEEKKLIDEIILDLETKSEKNK